MFIGVFGFGKSLLVFDMIVVEFWCMIDEMYSVFV